MIKEIFGKKLGMTQIFSEEGNLVAVTLLEIDPVCVLEQIQYSAKKVVKIGFSKLEGRKVSKLKKPVLGYFNKAGFGAYRFIREVIAWEVESGAEKEAVDTTEKSQEQEGGQNQAAVSEGIDSKSKKNKKEIGVELFNEGDIVNVRAKTKGRGFAGGMKRHGWSGQPKSHGSMTHRRIGSAGSSAYPSRIIKGLHMPGHMGNVNRTIKNLKVLKVDKDKNLLFIKGAIPGSRGTLVKVIKK